MLFTSTKRQKNYLEKMKIMFSRKKEVFSLKEEPKLFVWLISTRKCCATN